MPETSENFFKVFFCSFRLEFKKLKNESIGFKSWVFCVCVGESYVKVYKVEE